MEVLKEFLIFAVGFAVIIKSADLFTSAAESIALFFGIPRVIIGLTIVSLATTMPEFTVSTLASAMGRGSIAVGNAVGSCIVNIGLVLSVAALITSVKFEPRIIKREAVFLVAVSLLVFFFMRDGAVSFGEGVLLCVLLGLYFFYLIKRELAFRSGTQEKKEEGTRDLPVGRSIIKFLIGAAGVVLSAKFAIIPSGVAIAEFFRIPQIVIAISLIALGTSLPELVTAIVASAKKMGELAAGNVLGANILNLLWVLGVSAMIKPLPIDGQTRLVTVPVMIGMSCLVFIFGRINYKLSRLGGLVLLAGYVCYMIYLFKFAYV